MVTCYLTYLTRRIQTRRDRHDEHYYHWGYDRTQPVPHVMYKDMRLDEH